MHREECVGVAAPAGAWVQSVCKHAQGRGQQCIARGVGKRSGGAFASEHRDSAWHRRTNLASSAQQRAPLSPVCPRTILAQKCASASRANRCQAAAEGARGFTVDRPGRGDTRTATEHRKRRVFIANREPQHRCAVAQIATQHVANHAGYTSGDRGANRIVYLTGSRCSSAAGCRTTASCPSRSRRPP